MQNANGHGTANEQLYLTVDRLGCSLPYLKTRTKKTNDEVEYHYIQAKSLLFSRE